MDHVPIRQRDDVFAETVDDGRTLARHGRSVHRVNPWRYGPGVVLDFEASEGKLVASKTVERSPLDEVYGSLDLGEPVNDYIERIRGR